MIGGGYAAIDRLLQYDLLDVVGREAALRERRADVQLKFIPLAKPQQGSDHQYPAGALVEMRTGPDIRPRMTRDQIDEIRIEGIGVGGGFIDPGIAKYLAALRHAVVAAFLIVHRKFSRHCEERSDEAIHSSFLCLDCFA